MPPTRKALLLLLPLLALPAAAAAGKGKNVIKAKTTLAAGEPLRLDLNRDLAPCGEYDCFLYLGTDWKKPLYLLDLDAQGNWVAFGPQPDEEKKKKDKGKADEAAAAEAPTATGAAAPCAQFQSKKDEDAEAADKAEAKEEAKAKKKSKDEPEDESWKEKPVLSREQRAQKRWCDALGKNTIEKLTGALAVEGERRALLVPADLLPAEDFHVWTNGFWGATLAGVEVGQPSKTGAVTVER